MAGSASESQRNASSSRPAAAQRLAARLLKAAITHWFSLADCSMVATAPSAKTSSPFAEHERPLDRHDGGLEREKRGGRDAPRDLHGLGEAPLGLGEPPER